jgi:hypothetical protein
VCRGVDYPGLARLARLSPGYLYACYHFIEDLV